MSAGLQARGLKPAAQLAQARPHGDRLRYVGGCRCDLCRKANSAYECARQKARKAGDWNGIVSATKARKHIVRLADQGVGRRAIAAATDVADTVLSAIKAGTKTKIRARTERRILAVTKEMASDHALTDAGPTWRLIDELLEAGFTKTEISRRLGNKSPALQLSKKQVLVKHAAQIERIHRELTNSDAALVDAKSTWRLIDELLAEWFPIKTIAARLEVADRVLEVRKQRIPARLARAITALHQELTT